MGLSAPGDRHTLAAALLLIVQVIQEKDLSDPKQSQQSQQQPPRKSKVDTFAHQDYQKQSPLNETKSISNAASISEQIQQLRDRNFETRTRAEYQLKSLGVEVIIHLQSSLKSKDPQFRSSVNRILQSVLLQDALAKLENVMPGIEGELTISDSTKRLDRLLIWSDKVKPKAVIPHLITITQHAEAGSLLWGAWEALSYFANPELFKNMPLLKWEHSEDSRKTVYDLLCDYSHQINVKLKFGAAAEKICKSRLVSNPPQGPSGIYMLAHQLQALNVGFCLNHDQSIQILTPTEGARHWKEWWQGLKTENDRD